MTMLGKKLQSNRGMSILMGLLLLLVCATAGAAALTSAASNAGRYTHLRRDQQRYLTVASAARTVRDELCKGSYTATEVTDEEGVLDETRSTTSYAGPFADWLEELWPDGASPDDLRVLVDGEDSGVRWSLTLEDDHTLSAELWLEEDGNRYYPTTLTIAPHTEEVYSPPERDTSVAGQRWIITKTVTVTWSAENAVIRQA